MIYKPPQIPDEITADEIVENYSFDYRRMYIEHPRVRLDGVYIAVCHYMCVFSQKYINISCLTKRAAEKDDLTMLGLT